MTSLFILFTFVIWEKFCLKFIIFITCVLKGIHNYKNKKSCNTLRKLISYNILGEIANCPLHLEHYSILQELSITLDP